MTLRIGRKIKRESSELGQYQENQSGLAEHLRAGRQIPEAHLQPCLPWYPRLYLNIIGEPLE